jgi:hypothetical protein
MADLSANALALLTLLKAHGATAPARALTDRQLAPLLDLPERDIIDLAGELLDAGHPVAAVCTGRPGRFIAERHDLREYVLSLRRRALKVLRRYSAAKRALQRIESGQLPLFPGVTA